MPPNVHCSLFPISHFCVYSALRQTAWKLQVICGSLAYWTTALLSETFFVWFRVALEIQLESYSLRHASVVLWYTTLYAYTASLYIHCYLVRNYAWQQNSRTLWLGLGRRVSLPFEPTWTKTFEPTWTKTFEPTWTKTFEDSNLCANWTSAM